MPSGGYRANGKGPKPGAVYDKTLEKRAMREKTYAFVNEHLTHILTALLERAVGIAIIDKKDDTGEKIYDLPPDPAAAKILLEHAMGKAPESVDVTTGGAQLGIQISEVIALKNKLNASNAGTG